MSLLPCLDKDLANRCPHWNVNKSAALDLPQRGGGRPSPTPAQRMPCAPTSLLSPPGMGEHVAFEIAWFLTFSLCPRSSV